VAWLSFPSTICGRLGYGSLLFISRWQSGRDAKEVQGHYQDFPFDVERCSVLALW